MDYKNVLLTGATGFFGIHILENLIKHTTAKVYCLIRGENEEVIVDRLKEKLEFYFNEDFTQFIGDRIQVVKGDFSEEYLDMTYEKYKQLGICIDMVIHTGALVKHFGLNEEFEKVNVKGTEQMIKFASAHSIYLAYVSTIAVAGTVTNDENHTVFTENDLYIGQKCSSNVYVKSKLEAEKRVYAAQKEGLRGCVFRVGALTGRYKDGVFQSNINENALYSRMKVIIDSGVIPKEILKNDLEYTPVDCCSYALVRILQTEQETNRVFHLFNHNRLKFFEVINILKELGFTFDEVENMDFVEFRDLLTSRGVGREVFTGFFLYFRKKKDKEYKCRIKISSESTIKCLQNIGFTWPQIDKQYIEKIINYMKKNDYILSQQ